MSKYVRGQIVFILPSDRIVQEAVVEDVKDQEYTLSLALSGSIVLPEERIFSRRQGAEERLQKIREQKKNQPTYMDKIMVNALGADKGTAV